MLYSGSYPKRKLITRDAQDHPEVTAWVALDDLDFDWADSLRQAGPGPSSRQRRLAFDATNLWMN